MSVVDLPAPISKYFSAKGGNDPRKALECFTPDATVWDNGEDLELTGSEQIGRWLSGTVSSYNLTSEIRSVEQRDGAYAVGVIVSGDFPGSPYAFDYRFVLTGDRIAELTIDPIGPVSTT